MSGRAADRSIMRVPIRSIAPSVRFRSRFGSLCGATASGALIGLGTIWPSAFTVAALVALPAPLLFLAVAACPSFASSRTWLRRYLNACFVRSVAALLVEALWLARPG